MAYGLQGTHDHAIKDFNRAIELNPNHADAYNGRGIAYRQIGKLTRAIADFDRSIELNPNDAILTMLKGTIPQKTLTVP